MRMFRLIAFVVFCFAVQSAALAQGIGFTSIERDTVRVCPAVLSQADPPSFAGPECRSIHAYSIDPQNKAIWIKSTLNLDKAVGPNGEPLAVLVSGKFSSDVYLNGTFVGSNGRPSADRAREAPGKMDVVIHAPQTLFRVGENELILKASSHRGFLELTHPVHWIGIGPAADPQLNILAHYWPSLPMLGLFVLAMIYFVASAISGRQPRTSLSLFAMCAFAGLQLVAELSRGIIAYSYPTHDLRLVLIVVFSAGFGISFSTLVANLFAPSRFSLILIASLVVSAIGGFSVDGFDQKAATAMLAPMALSAVLLIYWTVSGTDRALRYLMISMIFVSANIVFLSYFLDVVFFYLVALLMIALLAERALSAAAEVRRRRDAESRADRLELALEQVVQAEKPVEIAVKSSGRIDRVSIDRIVQLRSSDGYTDILTDDGRELTHSESLSDLEGRLPVTFIRVHRSHLVNTQHVRTLKRNDQGNGWLVLSDLSEVPVSRRIMPTVRRVLG
jgi:hypothetical protein